MELTKLSGSTYYIQSPTNIGVYTFKNKECLIVDTGIGKSHAKKIDSVLEEKGLRPKYIINTHNHTDHCGGNSYFKSKYPGVQIYTSPLTKVCIENYKLSAEILFGASPINKLISKGKFCKVDYELQEGLAKIGDSKFEIISLKGHIDDQIGIITQDDVCFLGDSVFSKSILEKYSYPYLYDIKESIETMDRIKEIDARCFIIGHSHKVYSKEEICELIDYNMSNLNRYIEQITEMLSQPMTIEDLMENITVLNELELNFKQYYLNKSTTNAFISYLYNKGNITHSVDEGKLYFYVADK